MWQTLLLYKWKSLFGWLPIETLIRETQDEYYKVLSECDSSDDSGKFVEFLLKAINDALCEITDIEQVEKLLEVIGDKNVQPRNLWDCWDQGIDQHLEMTICCQLWN